MDICYTATEPARLNYPKNNSPALARVSHREHSLGFLRGGAESSAARILEGLSVYWACPNDEKDVNTTHGNFALQWGRRYGYRL